MTASKYIWICLHTSAYTMHMTACAYICNTYICKCSAYVCLYNTYACILICHAYALHMSAYVCISEYLCIFNAYALHMPCLHHTCLLIPCIFTCLHMWCTSTACLHISTYSGYVCMCCIWFEGIENSSSCYRWWLVLAYSQSWRTRTCSVDSQCDRRTVTVTVMVTSNTRQYHWSSILNTQPLVLDLLLVSPEVIVHVACND